MTKLYGVVGDPVSHSLSPVIHNAWIREHGLDATYEALHVPKGEFESGLSSLQDRQALGLNITLPHKEAAIQLAESASEVARKIGAANTAQIRWLARGEYGRARLHGIPGSGKYRDC